MMGPEFIQKMWNKFTSFPGGKTIFSKMLGVLIPYSGTTHPQVIELKPGYAKVQMKDRRKVRNHLNSIHAIALANFGELTSGLAFNYSLPKGVKTIVTELKITYLKKARGTLTAECNCDVISAAENKDYIVETVIRDSSGADVAKVKTHWKVSAPPACGENSRLKPEA